MADHNNQNVELLGKKGLIKKDEFVRLIIQSLYSLGFNDSAKHLENESNISYKSPQFALLESLVLEGNWDECNQVLLEIKDDLKNEKTRASVLSLILEQHIRECLSRSEVSSALSVLQKEYSEFGVQKNNIDHLGNLFVDKYYMQKLGDSVINGMRHNLVSRLELFIPPPIWIPERRLECLVEMSLQEQIYRCKYHNNSDAFSLYEDHCCGDDYIPTETVQVLSDHKDEVGFVQFSHNGEYLASSSKDKTAMIWKVPERGNLTLKHTLLGHQNSVFFLSWSPDDTMLLTCGDNEVLKLWDVETGACMHTFTEHIPILTCDWHRGSKAIAFGCSGAHSSVYTYEIDEEKLTKSMDTSNFPLTDLAFTPDGYTYIAVCSGGDIWVWNYRKGNVWNVKETNPITSVSVSGDSKYLLVNLMADEIHMWNLDLDYIRPNRFCGHKHKTYDIFSSFGGLDFQFIASGSEDSQVYIWNCGYEQPIKVLSGHSMVVNCVSWNPKRPQMLASASDDRTIRIWGSQGSNKSLEELLQSTHSINA